MKLQSAADLCELVINPVHSNPINKFYSKKLFIIKVYPRTKNVTYTFFVKYILHNKLPRFLRDKILNCYTSSKLIAFPISFSIDIIAKYFKSCKLFLAQ